MGRFENNYFQIDPFLFFKLKIDIKKPSAIFCKMTDGKKESSNEA